MRIGRTTLVIYRDVFYKTVTVSKNAKKSLSNATAIPMTY